MDTSTNGVMVRQSLIFDLLKLYKDNRMARPLFDMVKDLNENEQERFVPIDRYNEMCDWIEKKFGTAHLRKSGEVIGEEVYDWLLDHGRIEANSPPGDVLRALKKDAEINIVDPKKRGWEILTLEKNRAVMRRTQTYNRHLQVGLLKAIIQKTTKVFVQVKFLQSVADGAEFDDYEIKWTEI